MGQFSPDRHILSCQVFLALTLSYTCFGQVRREKISERMKLLQDLVPGCNKVREKRKFRILNKVGSST